MMRRSLALALSLAPFSASAFEPAPEVEVDRFVRLADPPWRAEAAEAKETELRKAADLLVVQRDEVAVRLDLCRPSDGRRLPAVLAVHGGGWTGGRKEAFRPIAEALAARGWVVASTSYRLASEAPFPGAVHDVKAAVRWIRAHAEEWGIDPDRIGAVGGSAGGHLVGLVATTAGRTLEEDGAVAWSDQSSLLQAAVLLGAGVDQLARALEAPRPIPNQILFFGGPVAERRASYIEGSPFHQLTAACPPLLFLDGEKDMPGQRYVAMRRRMDELAVPHELSVIEGCAHGAWAKEPWLPLFVGEIDRFLALHLKKP